MSTTHRALSAQARFSWLVRLAGAVTVSVALTLGAGPATAATAFAGPTPDPDPHSDTRSDDGKDDRQDDRKGGGSGDSSDDRTDGDSENDSEADPELEPGPRVGNSATGPRVVSGANQERLGEVHGTWRYRSDAGTGDWREAPGRQLVVTSDAVWVEVTGGPRSWCLDGATGQTRFPTTVDAVVRCG